MFTQTIPPPRETFNELVTQWTIFDAYAADYERQSKEREKECRKVGPPQPPGREGRKEDKRRHDKIAAEVQQKTRSAATILDRMICQNIFDEVRLFSFLKGFCQLRVPSPEGSGFSVGLGTVFTAISLTG